MHVYFCLTSITPMKNFDIRILFLLLFLSLSACSPDDIIDDVQPEANEPDVALEEALIAASNGEGLDYYKFPTQLGDIPQDPNNPLTRRCQG